MRLREALHAGIARLEADRIGSPRMNAEVLMMFTLGCDRAYLYAYPERELLPDEQARYDAAIAERASGKPSQYITGHQEFWGLDLVVSPAVLIPRPETEHVVETVLELVRHAPPGRLRIADVGTGSGCIALALANELRLAEVHATEISGDALEIARANAARLQLDSRVHFHQADLLGELAGRADFDLVVSNPPYVGADEADKVQQSVRDFEPRQAVFAGPSGLDVYRRLVPQAHASLRSGGWLVMEIGYSIAPPVQGLLEGWGETRVVPDLQGIPRVIAAQKP